ncbi:MAG: protein kinase domain-containing protein [Flavobacteriales bacterium]
MEENIKFPNTIYIENGKKSISIDIERPFYNILSINNIDYIPYYLNNLNPGNKGGNSYVLKLIKAQEYDEEEGYPEEPDLVMKICKFYKNKFSEHDKSLRFQKEIEALIDCNESKLPNIIEVRHHGLIECKVNKTFNTFFRYYCMDYAEFDLPEFLTQNNLNLYERVELCIEICQSLKQLWKKGYYHRDIKPDNILFINQTWRISDLGLSQHRDMNVEIDSEGDWIGPRGWMSPESMNKFLAETKPWNKLFDFKIDHQSDIFQLGKVFWYIFQGNSPEAGIRRIDFKWNNDSLYQIVRTMLNNSKLKRYKEIDEVIFLLKKIHVSILQSNETIMLY